MTPTIALITTLTTEKCNINAQCCDIWLLLSGNDQERRRCCGNACVCVVLTRVDRMKTDCLITKPSWRQAVRLKPTGSSGRCCQLREASLKAKQRGCFRALDGNHLGGNYSTVLVMVEPHPHVQPFWLQCLTSMAERSATDNSFGFGLGVHMMAPALNSAIDMLLL